MTQDAKELREDFNKQGFIPSLPILNDEELARYRGHYNWLEEQKNTKGLEKRLCNLHHYDPVLWEIANHPRLIEYAKSILGPNIILIATGFFSKDPKSKASVVDWHQDTMYWGMAPPFAVTFWLALDNSMIENGCLRVIPGTHKGLLTHETSTKEGNILGLNQGIPADQLDESKAVDVELQAGQASIHHGMLVHGSNQNTSGMRRCGMTIRLTTPDVKPIEDGPYAFKEKPYLLCGEDTFGHFDLEDAPSFKETHEVYN